jgi:hypothetical protein
MWIGLGWVASLVVIVNAAAYGVESAVAWAVILLPTMIIAPFWDAPPQRIAAVGIALIVVVANVATRLDGGAAFAIFGLGLAAMATISILARRELESTHAD